jgi:bile acid:Na+ symporter, BASS family
MTTAALIALIAQISLALLVLGVGLPSRWTDLAYALERPRLMVRGIIAVNIAVPVTAILVCMALPIEPMTKAGLIIMTVSPLAPFVVGKMLKSGSDRRYVVGMYVGLIIASVVIVPLTIIIVSRMFSLHLESQIADIAFFVARSVLIPIIVGVTIGTIWPEFGKRASRYATIAAYAALLPIAVILLVKKGPLIFGLLGDGTLLAILVILAVAIAVGHLLGEPVPEHRIALAEAAATRHPGIAALIAHRNFHDERVMLAVILFVLVSIIVTAIYERWAVARIKNRAPTLHVAE